MEMCNEGHETNLEYFTFLFSSRDLFVCRYLTNGGRRRGDEAGRPTSKFFRPTE